MSQTIVGKFFAVREEDYKGTIEYLKKIGMPFTSNVVDALLFHVEIKEIPRILLKLEQKGYLKSMKEWHILRISDEGIALYITGPHGDGYIFIPRDNIISIHTIDKEFLVRLQSD